MAQFNILYINSSATLFGAERRLIDIIEHLDNNKFKPFVLIPEHGMLEIELARLNTETFILDFRFKITKSNPIKFIILTKKLINFIQTKRINLIHINLHYYTSNFWLVFLLLRIPIVIHLRSTWWIHCFEKFVLSRYSKIICVSKSVQTNLTLKRRSDFFIKIRKEKLELLYDGIDVDRFNSYNDKKLKQELRIADENTIIALIGAIDPIKGQDVFIRAAKLVVETHPKTKFLLVGDLYHVQQKKIAYSHSIEQFIKEFNLENKITIVGYKNNMQNIMNSIDILVQPSKNEALGTSMIEAMSCCKPVIGTAVDGIPEVIGSNEEGGVLLRERTPEKLAETIRFLLDNPNVAKEKGLNGRKKVVELFNIDKNIRKLENIYLQEIKKLRLT